MCLVVNPICDIGKIAGAIGGKVAGSVFDQVAQAFADAADQLTRWMWTVIAKTTTVDLSGGWFSSTFGITTTLAGLVIVALFVLELIKAALRQEPGAFGRAVVGIGGGLLGAAASIAVVTALLSATDALSDGVVSTAGLSGIDKLGAEIAPTAALDTIGSPALMLVLGLGYLLASFFVWALFVMRKAMLIVAAVFAPVAFAGAPMRATSSWVRKWIEFTIALIFAKLVVVILFTLAISMVGSPGDGFAAVGNLFSGLAMLVVACFAPWLLFRLVHFVGGDIMHAHHQTLTQATIQAGSTPLTLARAGATKVGALVGAGGTAARPPTLEAPAGAGAGAGAAADNPTSATPSAKQPRSATGPPAPVSSGAPDATTATQSAIRTAGRSQQEPPTSAGSNRTPRDGDR